MDFIDLLVVKIDIRQANFALFDQTTTGKQSFVRQCFPDHDDACCPGGAMSDWLNAGSEGAETCQVADAPSPTLNRSIWLAEMTKL